MSEQGAIDSDFDDAEISYEQRVADALEDVRTEPVRYAGSLPGDGSESADDTNRVTS